MTLFTKLKRHVIRWGSGIFLVAFIVSELFVLFKQSKADIPVTLLDCSIHHHQTRSNQLRCTYRFELNNQHYLGESERAFVTLPLLFWVKQARNWHIQSVKNTPQMAYYPPNSAQTPQLWLHETWQNTVVNGLAVLTNIMLFLMLIPLYLIIDAVRKKLPWLNRDTVKIAQKPDSTRPVYQHVLHVVFGSILVVTVVFGMIYYGLLIYQLLNIP